MTMVAVQQLLREGDLQVGNLADKLGPIARALPSSPKNHLSVLLPVTPLRATQPYPRAVLRRTKGRLRFFGRRRLSQAVDSFVTPLVSAGLVHRPKRLRIRGIGDCRDPQLTEAGMQARDALRNQLTSGGGYQTLAERAGTGKRMCSRRSTANASSAPLIRTCGEYHSYVWWRARAGTFRVRPRLGLGCDGLAGFLALGASRPKQRRFG